MERTSTPNLRNFLIALLLPLPSLAFYLTFLHAPTSLPPLLIHYSRDPILLANILFFLNVNLLFWVTGLLISSHWMIDLYWSVIPVMLAHFYASHPSAAAPSETRTKVVILLTWLWSVRLTHSYFRRERWEWGAREDWRFNDMRKQYGKHWWWLSFFIVYVPQQVFLIGICLPMYAVSSVHKPWSTLDSLGTLVCLCGILIAYFADTQLHEFVSRNAVLKELGVDTVPVLDQGLWRYSRHPNYFAEQLWWWGLAVFAWSVGHGWTFVGPLINSLCLAHVTGMVEQRMLKQKSRADAYRFYQKTTSVWIPWFKSSQVKETKYKKT